MFKRHQWKLLICLLFVVWAVSELLPLHDIPFADYAREHATVDQAGFGRLLDEAAVRQKSGAAPSVFVGLKQIAHERRIDLSHYFPRINLESTLRNVDKRDDLLLKELLQRSQASLRLGLDLHGGVAVTLEVDPRVASQDSDTVRSAKLAKAIDIITNRINSFGVSEPVIRQVGDNRIEVELPGVNTKDNPEIVDEVKAPAKLEFRLVNPTVSPGPGVETPPGYELMTLEEDHVGRESTTEDLFIKRIPEMTGEIIANAEVRGDQFGQPQVDLQLTHAGQKRFAEVTRQIAALGQQAGSPGRLAIVLDGKLYSAPTVKEEIDSDSAVITGNFTDRDALDLANVLNNPLDLPLVVKEQNEIGPSLATDAISNGIKATVIGTAAVATFMIAFYLAGGLVAVFTLAINAVIILGVMASMGATMTLPGLAGIVLTFGMAVDANILIFERMREELAEGKPLISANQSGYRKALSTIVDAHIVQLIICTIMIWLGTGPIRGFGVTLAIGVLSTVFTVLIVAHMVMEMLVESGTLKKMRMNHLLKSIHVDFVRFGRPAFIVSWTVVLVGLCIVIQQGSRIYGIDFSGGDVITLQFEQRLGIDEVRAVASANRIGEVNPTYQSALGGGREQLRIETPEGKSGELLQDLRRAYPGAGLESVGQSHIGAAIGREIELNALLAVGASMLTILVYIAFRFEFGFGVGAMFSTLHDILMTIGIFVITGHKFSAPMVAAILCIAGYSINETVVVFDRIREELKFNPSGSLREVVNAAINKVFARTIMTATTTFLAALSLYLFGSGVLRDISFTFLVGIVTSTFSAIFIAAQVFYWWHKGDRKHVEAHSDVAPKYEWTGSSKASR